MSTRFRAEKPHKLVAHSASLYALAQGRDAQSIFTGGADRIVAEWQLDANDPNPFAIRVDATIYSLLNRGNQALLIGTAKGDIHEIDLASKKETRHLQLHKKGIFYLEWNTEKNHLYAASADGSLSIWNPDNYSLLWHLKLSDQKIRRTAVNSDGSLLAVACGDGRCLILETNSYRLIHEMDAHMESCNSLAFLPNGNLITGGKDAYLKVWDRMNGFQLLTSIPAHNYAIYDIIVCKDQEWIATASRDKTIKIWDLELSQSPLRLDRKSGEGHINSVNGLLLHQATNQLISCSDDRSALVWTIRSE